MTNYKTSEKQYTCPSKDGKKNYIITVKSQEIEYNEGEYKENGQVKVKVSLKEEKSTGEGSEKAVTATVSTGLIYDSLKISSSDLASDIKEDLLIDVSGYSR